MFEKIFIGIISINRKNAEKTKKRISKSLQIPLQLINIFVFPIEKDKTQKNKAISISHQNIIKQAYEDNEFVLIFEEDVDFYENQNNHEIFKNSFLQIQKIKDWDILFLGCFNPLYYNNVDVNLEKVYYGLGTHGYILSKKGMKKVINFDFTNIQNIPFFDVSLQQIDFGVTGLMNGYQMKPMIAYQNKTPRLISFINNYYNRKGSFQNLMHKYIKIFWHIILIIILMILLKLYYLFKN